MNDTLLFGLGYDDFSRLMKTRPLCIAIERGSRLDAQGQLAMTPQRSRPSLSWQQLFAEEQPQEQPAAAAKHSLRRKSSPMGSPRSTSKRSQEQPTAAARGSPRTSLRSNSSSPKRSSPMSGHRGSLGFMLADEQRDEANRTQRSSSPRFDQLRKA